MEAGSLDISLYKHALIVLGAAGVVIPVFHRLHISSVLGFILVGIVVGPFGLASLTSHLPWLSAITAMFHLTFPPTRIRYRSIKEIGHAVTNPANHRHRKFD
jgi:hypothetical protein